MKFRTAVAVTCLAVFGFSQIADARPRSRHHVAKKASSRGVNVSTSDVNGDGVPDVVTGTKSKSSAYPGMSMTPKDLNGDGLPDAPTVPKSKPKKRGSVSGTTSGGSIGGVYVQ